MYICIFLLFLTGGVDMNSVKGGSAPLKPPGASAAGVSVNGLIIG